jgi:hypothetical protein
VISKLPNEIEKAGQDIPFDNPQWVLDSIKEWLFEAT